MLGCGGIFLRAGERRPINMNLTIMAIQTLCPCGQPKETWQDDYAVYEFDESDRLLWATCPHGLVIVDNRDLPERDVSPKGERVKQ